MKGYFTVSKTGRRLFLAGVFVNPGETSGVLEITARHQVEWILSKIRNREVSFAPYKSVESRPVAEKAKPVALPMQKESTSVVKHKKRVSLPASIPNVTTIAPIAEKHPKVTIAAEEVVEAAIATAEENATPEWYPPTPPRLEEVVEEIVDEAIEEVVEETVEEVVEAGEDEEDFYNVEEKQAEYEELKYQQLFAKARAYDLVITGRPKKEELIALLIAAKV